MIVFLTYTFVCIFFIFIDLVPIYQNKQWWPFSVYSTMLVLVYTLALLNELGFMIPSPATPLKKIISKIWGI